MSRRLPNKLVLDHQWEPKDHCNIFHILILMSVASDEKYLLKRNWLHLFQTFQVTTANSKLYGMFRLGWIVLEDKFISIHALLSRVKKELPEAIVKIESHETYLYVVVHDLPSISSCTPSKRIGKGVLGFAYAK
ncbi:hypothetical protein V6N11_001557 [Hibiscus sabdariffa]|uniref:Uncharacterized protein n=1 Tax=Hibiscus sabdariffa TaxID=183260 RepID=A0ABR2S032_9ROSI